MSFAGWSHLSLARSAEFSGRGEHRAKDGRQGQAQERHRKAPSREGMILGMVNERIGNRACGVCASRICGEEKPDQGTVLVGARPGFATGVA